MVGRNVMAGIDVVRARGLVLGLAAAVDLFDRDVSTVRTVAWNVWRNIDLYLASGYGTAGDLAGVTVGIE